MKKSGGYLVRFALEQLGIKHTFGVPGVHNTEIYDELEKSKNITPLLVTHECGGTFMADAISRTSNLIGTSVIVPAAGTTHAMSGIAESYLDGIPQLIISGGVRIDSGKKYQLHQLDQEKLVQGAVKKYILVNNHNEIIPSLYDAYEIATSGCPGPVFIEIPSNSLLFTGEVNDLPVYQSNKSTSKIDSEKLDKIVTELITAKNPGIYLGWGAKECTKEMLQLAEALQAPVSTTMQGLSVFPANHPLHTGMGFGPSSVPAAENAFKKCDCLLAVGARFSELASGSYGLPVPSNLIHIDIDPEVFNTNYPANISYEGDALIVVSEILNRLKKHIDFSPRKNSELVEKIQQDKDSYFNEWANHDSKDRVNPATFFYNLRRKLNDDDFVVLDDGNHTFLASELFPVNKSKCLISPTDFNAMGYCVPASIGAKIANPDKTVVGIVGDGSFLMTGLELLTASYNNLGIVIFIFNDGELGQISQFQKTPLNKKTCTVLPEIKMEGIALATGAQYLELNSNDEASEIINKAIELSKDHKPVIVDVKIDYSKKTRFTKGVVKVNLKRFPLGQKARFIGRALKRHTLG